MRDNWFEILRPVALGIIDLRSFPILRRCAKENVTVGLVSPGWDQYPRLVIEASPAGMPADLLDDVADVIEDVVCSLAQLSSRVMTGQAIDPDDAAALDGLKLSFHWVLAGKVETVPLQKLPNGRLTGKVIL